MKTGFLQALIGSCKGTAIFVDLLQQSVVRSLLHLLLLLFLAAALVCAGNLPEKFRILNRGFALLEESFGAVVIENGMIFPEKSPELSRDLLLPGDVSIVYLENRNNAEAKALLNPERLRAERGIIWSKDCFAVWGKLSNADKRYDLQVISGNSVQLERFSDLTAEALVQKIQTLPSARLFFWGEKHATPNSNATESVAADTEASSQEILPLAILHRMAKWLLPGIYMAGFFLYMSIQVLLCIAMFVGVFAVMSMARPRRLPLSRLWVLATYAGFPAIVIGAGAAALDLPFLDFNLIYVLGMTFYLMVVMNRLERQRQQRENPQERS